MTVTLTTITHVQKHIDGKGEGGTQAPEKNRKLDNLETLMEGYIHTSKETTVKTAVKEEFITGGKKWTVGWLNWFNAESSLKRYWRGPRSEEVGVRRRLYLTLYTLSPPEELLHFKMGSNESHFKVSLIVRGKVTKTAFINHNF